MQVQKVNDPTKRVTDPVILAALARHGIDSGCVEFTQDYGKAVKGVSSPYIKYYRDLKSDKRFAVISQLPMVDADGNPIEVGWQTVGKGFEAKNNLFTAKTSGLETTLSVRNDQPGGRKVGHEVTYHPQLFLNDIEQKSASESATLLEVDPENENYRQNVLQWDYGVCKRRLRITEGRLLGSWVFEGNPKGEVRIKYNQSGDFKLKLGQFKIDDDEEVIPTTYFGSESQYPVIINDSSTFYPDAHTETSSVDGYVAQEYSSGSGVDWATLVAGAGSAADDSSTTLGCTYITSDTVNNKWVRIRRGVTLFDTSSLPDNATITDATLSIYGLNKSNALGITPIVNVYSSAPASNTALVAGDYDSLGSTPFCDTPITYSNWKVASPYWNDFVLNTAGIAAISLTGISKFGLRDVTYDVGNSAPAWTSNKSSFLQGGSADKGTGYKPKLVVTYTVLEVKTSGDNGAGAESTCERQLGATEAGAGVETSLPLAVVLAGDGGSGTEVCGLQKTLFGQDKGGGADSLKILTGKAGSDLRLHSHQGQVSIPHKEVNL